MSTFKGNRGRAVLRISMPWMINVVQAVDDLARIQRGQTYSDAWPWAYGARTQLEMLFNQSLYSASLRSSRQPADELHSVLSQVIGSSMAEVMSDIHVWQVDSLRQQFRTVFLAELGTLPNYFVLPKPPYDTNTLLDGGEALMPTELGSKVPEALFDAREAAKALAFELATACGFHTFRVLESVVRRYHKEVTGGQAEPKQRNLGVYIRALTKAKANQRIIAALTQIKDLHRNPLIHPEVALRLDEAVAILGMAHSVVSAMLNELPEPPQTTTTASA